MAQVVVRGESVYECDKCNRKVRVPSNRQGLDVLQRCIITYGCRGSLRRLTQAKDINSTPAFPPEVPGIQDWFQRRVFYVHEQTVSSATWTINHNLANNPNIYVFVNTTIDGEEAMVEYDAFTVTTIDQNTTLVTFAGPQAGIAQAVALSSQNTSNPEVEPVDTSSNPFQVTSNVGEITIATRNSGAWGTSDVDFTLAYQLTAGPLELTYPSIDAVPSIDSPWVGVEQIIANGKSYSVRSFNIVNTLPAPPYFASGQIQNGTIFALTKLNGTVIAPGDAFILLGRQPYAAVDRIYDQVVDAGRPGSNLVYDTGTAYTQQGVLKSLYPPITVV